MANRIVLNNISYHGKGAKMCIRDRTWSCYEGGEKPCGVCGTCRDRAAAFAANGVPDPALGGE